MTRIERIKEHTWRHGYSWREGGDDHRIRLRGQRIAWCKSETDRGEVALKHFLLDKSATGARIADLGAIGIWDQVPEDGKAWLVQAHRYPEEGERPSAEADDIDQAIAALWLKVFIDTEVQP